MPTETDRLTPNDGQLLPTQALLSLISEIAEAPELEVRLRAAIALTMQMSNLGPEQGSLDDALALARKALVGGCAVASEYDASGPVSEIDWQPAHGDDRYADLVLEMMMVDDFDVRRVALEALVVGVAPQDGDEFAVTEQAIRRFLGWVSHENRTRH